MAKTSKLSGFYKLSPKDRLKIVSEFSGLTDEEASCVSATGALSLDAADRMVENLIGVMEVPMGVAVNFLINDKDYLIPMALEEPSVIAAASNSAKMAREGGGFTTRPRPQTQVPVPCHAEQAQRVEPYPQYASPMQSLVRL